MVKKLADSKLFVSLSGDRRGNYPFVLNSFISGEAEELEQNLSPNHMMCSNKLARAPLAPEASRAAHAQEASATVPTLPPAARAPPFVFCMTRCITLVTNPHIHCVPRALITLCCMTRCITLVVVFLDVFYCVVLFLVTCTCITTV